MNNTKNTVTKIIVAVLIFAALYLGVKQINKPKVTVGAKAVEIIVVDHEEKSIYKEVFNTDSELLGDLLDEINEKEALFTLDGDKESEFGRFIASSQLLEANEGEFWVYDSENNKVCVAEAFCPGIDALAIEDKDTFTFNILKP